MRQMPPMILLLLLAACSATEERAVQRALHKGAREYRAHRFAQASATFSDAPADVRLAYNGGNAHYRDGRYAQAARLLQDAARMTDSSGMKARALHNLGNALVLQAREADSLARAYAKEVAGIRIEGDDIREKVGLYVLRDSLRRDIRRLDQLVDSALKAGAEAYRGSLRSVPTNEDARHNLVAAQRLIAERPKGRKKEDGNGDDDKKALGEKARGFIEQADELVEQYRFTEALALLHKGLQEDPTLEQRKEYMDKLELVTKAAETQ